MLTSQIFAHEIKKAKNAGSWAYKDGLSLNQNPFLRFEEELQRAWKDGWMQAWEMEDETRA